MSVSVAILAALHPWHFTKCLSQPPLLKPLFQILIYPNYLFQVPAELLLSFCCRCLAIFFCPPTSPLFSYKSYAQITVSYSAVFLSPTAAFRIFTPEPFLISFIGVLLYPVPLFCWGQIYFLISVSWCIFSLCSSYFIFFWKLWKLSFPPTFSLNPKVYIWQTHLLFPHHPLLSILIWLSEHQATQQSLHLPTFSQCWIW